MTQYIMLEVKSIESIVEIINRGGNQYHYPFQIAGIYANQEAEEKFNVDQLRAHLDILREHGAMMPNVTYDRALQFAITIAEEEL